MQATATPTKDRTTQDQILGRQFLNDFLADPTAHEATLLGYAGVGKTWLVADWLAEVLELYPDHAICVAAPTHKALDVMRQKCGHLPVTFKTLHSLLGLIIARNDEGDVDRSLAPRDESYTFLWIDEGSMEGEEFDRLIRQNTGKGKRFNKVLHTGDPAQLPPVKEDLSPIFKIPRSFTMREVVRFDSGILQVATFMRERIESQRPFNLFDIKELTDPADRSVCHIQRASLYTWAAKAIERNLDCRIIAWTNAAVLQHNKRMHELLFPDLDPNIFFHIGEKVLLNDSYTLRKDQGGTQASDDDPPDSLYNGEVLTTTNFEYAEPIHGVAVRVVTATRADGKVVNLAFAPNEAHRLAVHKALNEEIYNMEFGAKRTELAAVRRKINRLAPLRHAYAGTVHKSQGSTYDIAMVDFSDIFRSDDRARLLYVGASRPSMHLVFVR